MASKPQLSLSNKLGLNRQANSCMTPPKSEVVRTFSMPNASPHPNGGSSGKVKLQLNASLQISNGSDSTLDSPMTGLSSGATSHFSATDMIEPLNLTATQQLGEPDPTAIAKHDLLSAVAFDRTGTILSVGDRGGRIICFSLEKDERGIEEFDYMTEITAFTKKFDGLTSRDISEQITAIEWLNNG